VTQSSGAEGPDAAQKARIAALEAKIDALQQFLSVQDETVLVQTTRLEALSEDRRQLLSTAIRVAERERMRVAEELHDGAIQHLVAISYKIDRAAAQLARTEVENVRTSLEQIREGIARQLEGLRALMTRLRPPSLDVTGVKAAIQDFTREYAIRTGIQTVTTINHDERLASEIESVLYRVTLESLSNVAQHADAQTVRIEIGQDQPGWVRLVITDDGKGFDVARLDSLVRDGLFGLAGVRESVENAGGRFELTSAAGSGTQLTVRLPVPDSS
jgi:signal transduction histidine kinase